ncbi:MAG: HEAT repeat domain-containing protein [Myxococcales bacterium]|nr:HEAT repeat domain-containing protein [Myxococcota bacterium]MDW8280508.1 HEAT repeat domain-containing protein [Myxococcales bacterium]
MRNHLPHLGASERGRWARQLALTLALWAQATPVQAQATVATEQQARMDKLLQTLRSDPSYQVRLQAAAVLGKLGDRNAVPVLIQALIEDKHELVRATCADALGQLADAAARPALEAARADASSLVRARAAAALQRLTMAAAPVHPEEPSLPERSIVVALGRMGSKARGVTADLPKRLRETIARELMGNREVQLVDDIRQLQSGFAVESSVTEMSGRMTADGHLEVSCEVSMVIMLMPSRSIVGMTSGGATIQAPRRLSQGDRAARQAVELDALRHAVRGASQNLLTFLRNQR